MIQRNAIFLIASLAGISGGLFLRMLRIREMDIDFWVFISGLVFLLIWMIKISPKE